MLAVIITVVVSLALSAFFSGMEIAFLSSNKLKLEIEKKQSRAFGYVAGLFSKYPGQYITTILVGNNLALVIYSLQMSVLIQLLLVRSGLILGNGASYVIETLVSTLIIIFTAEFIPKAVVHLNPNFYYKNFAVPVYFFYLLFYPVAKLTTLIAVGIFKIFGLSLNREQRINTFNKVDLAHLLDEVSDSPEQQQNEKDIRLFQNALDFSDRLVRDCMVPRVDIEAVIATVDLDAIIDTVDLDRAVSHVDVDAVINRVDLIGLADVVIDGVDLPGIIREASTSVTADVMTDVRSTSERADDAVAVMVGRLLRRRVAAEVESGERD